MVRSFFHDPDHRPTEIALAVFSCEPDGIFEARRLPEDVRRLLVYFDDHFELEPLLAQMERWPPTVVAVVEKDQVRLFTAFLDDVEEVGHHKMAIDIRRDDRRGQSEQFEREEGTGVRLNLKEAVQWLESQHLQRQGYTSLYLAGPVQARSQFKHLLPQPWRQALRGEFGGHARHRRRGAGDADSPGATSAAQSRSRLADLREEDGVVAGHQQQAEHRQLHAAPDHPLRGHDGAHRLPPGEPLQQQDGERDGGDQRQLAKHDQADPADGEQVGDDRVGLDPAVLEVDRRGQNVGALRPGQEQDPDGEDATGRNPATRRHRNHDSEAIRSAATWERPKAAGSRTAAACPAGAAIGGARRQRWGCPG